MKTANKNSRKINGRIYTPQFLVNCILDFAGYTENTILKKHIIDNSCGNGAFLTNIAVRYCKTALASGYDLETLKADLSRFIHGIEIDDKECARCIENLNKAVGEYGIENVAWDVICADALNVDAFDGKMDFVVGNPPYVRVHNLSENRENVKKLTFLKSGMIDLYLAFYEIGLKMLSPTGILAYITPSSFFGSVAGRCMRRYVIQHNLLDRIIDMKHYQPFDAATYTAITVLSQNRTAETTDYFEFDEQTKTPFYVATLRKEEYCIDGDFHFSTKRNLERLKTILKFKTEKRLFAVKNGFATLADKFFIGSFDFTEHIIPIVKASTGLKYQCFFPYENGSLIPYPELTKSLTLKRYYESFEDELKKRSLENKEVWHGFGRSQGINDVGQCKYAVNVLIRTPEDIKLVKCEEGVGVYSGLYILTAVSENRLRELLISEDFIVYVSLLGKYKSGGYYTFSSKDLELYLEYKNLQTEEIENERCAIFGNA